MSKDKQIAVRGKQAVEKQDFEPTRADYRFSPSVDIYADESAITVVADVPGVKKEDLEVDVKDRVLTITGGLAEPDKRLRPVYSEYDVGGYMRRFSLGDDIDAARIQAELKDGVLKVVLPKVERLKPRKVEIQVG